MSGHGREGVGGLATDSTFQFTAFHNFSGPRYFKSDAFRSNESLIRAPVICDTDC